jgi:hypothetical protein
MAQQQIGLTTTSGQLQLDEWYFDAFEQQVRQPTKHIREDSSDYHVAQPADDLITLRALYESALHIEHNIGILPT